LEKYKMSLDKSFFNGVRDFDLTMARLLNLYDIIANQEKSNKELVEFGLKEFKKIIINNYGFFIVGIEAGIFNELELNTLQGFYEVLSREKAKENEIFLKHHNLIDRIKAYKGDYQVR